MINILNNKGRFANFGLLFIRLGLGISMALHGWPKITGGLDKWEQIGGVMKTFGIEFMPGLWGFMAGFAEFGCGILLMAGLLFAPACLMLAFTMFVATMMHVNAGDSFISYSHALELLIVFIGLIITGPGKFSLDNMIVNYLPKKNQMEKVWE